MSFVLDPTTLSIIQATSPWLEEHAEEVTRCFYERMFAENPEVRPMFNPSHQATGRQQRALAGAILAYAAHIAELSALGDAVELIAHKHASLGVEKEHYPIVGRHLLAAIDEVLGDSSSPEILDAWGQAYGLLASILIEREGSIYKRHEAHHGWKGFKRFRVMRRVEESVNITSFHLRPVDDHELVAHLPGQYITIKAPAQVAGGQTTMRNYSLSQAPGAPFYRISVKRERVPERPDGLVSNWLHDHVGDDHILEVGPPCGEFVLDTESDDTSPLVFLSGGVGITPTLSMLHAAAAHARDREVHFIHATYNGNTHAFRNEVIRLAASHGRTNHHVFYEAPTVEDREFRRFDKEGRVDRDFLERHLRDVAGEFYFCGPGGFMATIRAALLELGVAQTRLHFEAFGPLESL